MKTKFLFACVSILAILALGACDSPTKSGLNNSPPYDPSLIAPTDGATSVSRTPTMSWTGGDPDLDDTVKYTLYLGRFNSPDSLFAVNGATDITGTSVDIISSLAYGTTYYWSVIAQDRHNELAVSETWSFTTVQGIPNLTIYQGAGSSNTYTYNSTSHALVCTTSVQNNGTASSGSFRVAFYLSTNNIISTSDFLLASGTQSSMNPNTYQNWFINVDLDNYTSLPHATYYVGVIFDDLGQVSESDRTDNTVVFTPTITY